MVISSEKRPEQNLTDSPLHTVRHIAPHHEDRIVTIDDSDVTTPYAYTAGRPKIYCPNFAYDALYT